MSGLKPHKRARLGIARTFQRLEIFGSLSVRENVLAAAEIRRRWSHDRSDAAANADGVLALVGLTQLADRAADTLPTGQARLLELARALATRPRLLLLDEPSSGLSDTESEELGDLLCQLADAGMGVLLVEHDMELVMRICTRDQRARLRRGAHGRGPRPRSGPTSGCGRPTSVRPTIPRRRPPDGADAAGRGRAGRVRPAHG